MQENLGCDAPLGPACAGFAVQHPPAMSPNPLGEMMPRGWSKEVYSRTRSSSLSHHQPRPAVPREDPLGGRNSLNANQVLITLSNAFGYSLSS
jgi:hypothetical protein